MEAAGTAGLGQDRVHLVVDSDAAVARAPRGLLGEPVVLVVVSQQVLQGAPENVQQSGVEVPAEPQNVHEEVGRTSDLQSHDALRVRRRAMGRRHTLMSGNRARATLTQDQTDRVQTPLLLLAASEAV